MEYDVERELVVPDEPEQVWETLSEPEWLGEDASIDLAPRRRGARRRAQRLRRGGRGAAAADVLVERRGRGVDARGARAAAGRRRHARARRRVAPAGACSTLVGPDFALPRSASAPRTPEMLAA